MKEKFFYENDVRVTKTAIKVMRWLIIIFPLLIILSLVGVFQSKIENLIPLTIIAIVVTMGPTVPRCRARPPLCSRGRGRVSAGTNVFVP